jgi:hypothetical protein
MRSHAAFLATGLALSLLLSCVRGIFDRGSVLPPLQEFIVSTQFGLLVTLASWLGYAGVVSGLMPRLGRSRTVSIGPAIASALAPVILVYSGLLPRLIQILRRDLGLHTSRMLLVLAVLPIVGAASSALVLRASRRLSS